MRNTRRKIRKRTGNHRRELLITDIKDTKSGLVWKAAHKKNALKGHTDNTRKGIQDLLNLDECIFFSEIVTQTVPTLVT